MTTETSKRLREVDDQNGQDMDVAPESKRRKTSSDGESFESELDPTQILANHSFSSLNGSPHVVSPAVVLDSVDADQSTESTDEDRDFTVEVGNPSNFHDFFVVFRNVLEFLICRVTPGKNGRDGTLRIAMPDKMKSTFLCGEITLKITCAHNRATSFKIASKAFVDSVLSQVKGNESLTMYKPVGSNLIYVVITDGNTSTDKEYSIPLLELDDGDEDVEFPALEHNLDVNIETASVRTAIKLAGSFGAEALCISVGTDGKDRLISLGAHGLHGNFCHVRNTADPDATVPARGKGKIKMGRTLYKKWYSQSVLATLFGGINQTSIDMFFDSTPKQVPMIIRLTFVNGNIQVVVADREESSNN